MKKYQIIGLLIVGLMTTYNIKAENNLESQKYWAINQSDPFLEPTCPLMDGATMFVLRQKEMMRGFETIFEGIIGSDSSSSAALRKARMEAYIPVVNAELFEYMIGTKYEQTDILSQDDKTFGKTVNSLWLWNAAKYIIDERNNVMLLLECYDRGMQKKSFEQKFGDQILGYGLYNYAFSRKLQLIVIAGDKVQYLADEVRNGPLIGAELRWEPNDKFKTVVGAPSIAFEWSIIPELEIAAKYYLMNQEIGAFLRYRINEKYGISLVYNRTNNQTRGTYFERQTYQASTEEFISYSNLSQMTDQISLDVGIHTTKNVGVNVSLGYTLGEDIAIRDNLIKLGVTPGRNEPFLRIQIHHLNFWN